jgi:tRNA(Arg) A34 adenosine deaminase TadA
VEFESAWRSTGLGVRRSLELAHASLIAGGLPVGSVLLDGGGNVVAEGRNRAYDSPGGKDALQGSPIAHAEMNVLAAVATATDLASMTLWSSHRPCSMCAAACGFTGVGTVRYVAPDPSDETDGSDQDETDGSDQDAADGRWLVVANLLFLSGILAYSGPTSPFVNRVRPREPEITGLLDTLDHRRLRQVPLDGALAVIWSDVERAADRRRTRLNAGSF